MLTTSIPRFVPPGTLPAGASGTRNPAASREKSKRRVLHRLAGVLAPAALLIAGCGGHVSAFGTGETAAVSIHAAATHIDTNGRTQFTATLANGEPATVEWSVSGGDPSSGPGSISSEGVYTPPSYLTHDSVSVSVSAILANRTGDSPLTADSAVLTITPGFLQPLTPGNLSLGPNATVTITGSMTEVGGTGGIRFALATGPGTTPTDEASAETSGTLSTPHCIRGSINGSNPAYTVCSVTYTAPAVIPASGSIFVVGSAGSSPTLSWTRILLNSSGISSNPAAHQAHLATPVQLGSSSGNNTDYDSSQGQLSDCCGGTLGALLQDTSGNQYVLSNNHVLARSDQSIPGETVIQPGLIDNGCTPYGLGSGTTPVATLSGYPALSSSTTNVDAAIARVTPGAVDPKGNILELGAKQQDGTLAAASPGISSTGGRGETATLGMMVAKSGRTTGLTCAAVSATHVDVVVDYFTDCAETSRSMTKTFTNQIAISGASFSDAGDSGALVVDSSNAEPVGLFFAGGTDGNGVEHAIANPVGDVLATLNNQVPGPGGPTTYSFVGGQDHPVSCLSYGSTRISDEATAASLPAAERERVEGALPLAQLLLNSSGIVRTGITASKDHPGQGAIALYLQPGVNPATLPASIGGVATALILDSSDAATPQPRPASLNQTLLIKQRNSATLLKSNPAIFGVGIGQSLDNPNDAAILLFADRHKIAASQPDSIEGQRVRVILMDRLHVTRSHNAPAHRSGNCSQPRRADSIQEEEPATLDPTPFINPFQNRLQLPK